MYKIVEEFTSGARELAASLIYEETDKGRRYEGFCPLGIMIAHDILLLKEAAGRPRSRTPSPYYVADILRPNLAKGFEDVFSDANTLITDWDCGKIVDQREAFGVKGAAQ